MTDKEHVKRMLAEGNNPCEWCEFCTKDCSSMDNTCCGIAECVGFSRFERGTFYDGEIS